MKKTFREQRGRCRNSSGFESARKHLRLLALPMMLCQFGAINSASAQLPMPASSQFDITGFIEEATVTNPADSHSGGTLKVNGQTIVIPAETVVMLPANALTWQELFAQAPAPWGIPGTTTAGGGVAYNGAAVGPTTGMAAADCGVAPTTAGCAAPPISTYEVHVVGNRVICSGVPAATTGCASTSDTYIAGLVSISQQDLNNGAGYINYIDYAFGEIRVGGTIGSSTTGTRVRINDPVGRFGLSTTSPDIRFTVDADNPTIAAGTGFPMCLPRVAPTGPNDSTSDPLCPQTNRPQVAGVYTTNVQMGLPNSATLDPMKQAPLEIGDYVNFAGTLVKDCPTTGCPAGNGPTVGPWPPTLVGPPPSGSTASTYISAHTIGSNVAIYTQPGINPAYVSVEVALIGTGGLTVLGAGEAVIRTRFEGMTTDPSRNIHLYGIDVDPLTGVATDRDWGTVGVDPGAPVGAVRGRWRFRPPCTATPSTITDKTCSPPPTGTFLPPTREVRAVVEGTHGTPTTAANGILAGQYHAPIEEYIFPENIPGTPIVENNFNTIGFLAKGGYFSAGGTLAGVLNPWPSSAVPVAGPPPTCTTTPQGPDVVVITSALYRTSKQRLVVTANDSPPPGSQTPTLTLLPYACQLPTPAGTPPCPSGTFDPSTLGNTFTNVGGVLTLTLVGAPEPAISPASPLVVHSSLGGCSSPAAITVRQ